MCWCVDTSLAALGINKADWATHVHVLLYNRHTATHAIDASCSCTCTDIGGWRDSTCRHVYGCQWFVHVLVCVGCRECHMVWLECSYSSCPQCTGVLLHSQGPESHVHVYICTHTKTISVLASVVWTGGFSVTGSGSIPFIAPT